MKKYYIILLVIAFVIPFSFIDAQTKQNNNFEGSGMLYVKFIQEEDFGDQRFLEIESVPIIASVEDEYEVTTIENSFFFVEMETDLKKILRISFENINQTAEFIDFLNNQEEIEYAEEISQEGDNDFNLLVNSEPDVLVSSDFCNINYSQLIRYGRVGADVRQTQECLQNLGYEMGPIDGIYGPKTYAGIVAFQTAQNIKIDGIVGPQTVSYLNKL